MAHRDAHWSCEELLGTEGPGRPADTEALRKETNQTYMGLWGADSHMTALRLPLPGAPPRRLRLLGSPRGTHGHRGRVLAGISRRPL